MFNNQMVTMMYPAKMQASYASKMLQSLLLLGLLMLLSACGNDTGNAENEDLTVTNQGGLPQTTDTANFKREFWSKLNTAETCAGCHDLGGPGSTKFVNTSDVNDAYAQTLGIVDFDTPSASDIVTKFMSPSTHNCWLESDQDCADTITSYIENWVAARDVEQQDTQIELIAPLAIKDAGDSRNFPADTDANSPNSFADTVYPLLRTNCASCHAESSTTPQSPFFANTDINSAYQFAKTKMKIDFTYALDADGNTLLDSTGNPVIEPSSPILTSRLIVRLREEFHNCWSGSCTDDAQDMEDAIKQFAGNITIQPIDSDLIISKAMQLGDAMIASSGIRHEADVIALYEFKQGSGLTAADTSGVSPLIPLTLNSSVSWVSGYGIEILSGGKAQGSFANSKKLSDHIKASGEYAIEAWLVPGNVVQNGASIVTYSGGGAERNFTMGQSEYKYDFVNDNSVSGQTTLSTEDEDLQATQQHVVMNFSSVTGRRIYVNGVYTEDMDIDAGGELNSAWNDTYPLALGNEPGGGTATQWKGKIRLLAIHSRALTESQILQNLQVGVGQKYFMLFSIEDRIAVPGSYILFQVEQFDNTAYLFSRPTFVNLDPDFDASTLSSIAIKSLRIGVNSNEAVAGQAFGNIDTVVDSGSYGAAIASGVGQELSSLGTIIAVEKGPDTDEFFLSFEQLGSASNIVAEGIPADRVYPADPAQNSFADIGMRTFDEINETIAAITGINKAVNLTAQELALLVEKDLEYRRDVNAGDPLTPLTDTEQLNKTFTFYRQQLPSVENIQAFLSSHQMGVAQLAVKYCDVLVETNPSFFQDENNNVFAMGAAPAVAFANAAERNKVTHPLLKTIMNVDGATLANVDGIAGLTNQPNEADDNVVSILSAANASAGFDADFPELSVSLMDEMMAQTACFYFEGDDDATLGLEQSISCTSAERTRQIVKASCAALLGSAVMLVQ